MTPTTRASASQAERELFEADVIESKIGGGNLAQDKPGSYSDPTVADHWETWQTAWQARAAQPTPQVQDNTHFAFVGQCGVGCHAKSPDYGVCHNYFCTARDESIAAAKGIV